MTLEEQIVQILEECKREIQTNLQAKNINASGRTSASLRTEVTTENIRLVVGGGETAPIETLEVGRPGGPVPRGFQYIIWQWMEDKGIASGNAKEDFRRAGAIAYGPNGIRAIGTKRNQVKEDVYSTASQNAVVRIREAMHSSIGAALHAAITEANVSSIQPNF